MLMRGYQPAAAQENSKASEPSLLGLPAELRIRIYEFCLTGEDRIAVSAGPEEPGLLLVNRQIRKEARPIWYSGNMLCIGR